VIYLHGSPGVCPEHWSGTLLKVSKGNSFIQGRSTQQEKSGTELHEVGLGNLLLHRALCIQLLYDLLINYEF